MNLVLLGAPGAGKGTQAEIISKKLGMKILSTGNLLREAVNEGTELGKQVESLMKTGALLPDELIISLVREKLASDECKNGVIFDGFPRTESQAKALDELTDIPMAMAFAVPDENIIERMSSRRTCPKCQKTYNLKVLPPKIAGKCDDCGTELYVRPDDDPEVVKKRLEVYHKETESIIDYYRKSCRLVAIDGTQHPDDVSKQALKALGAGL